MGCAALPQGKCCESDCKSFIAEPHFYESEEAQEESLLYDVSARLTALPRAALLSPGKRDSNSFTRVFELHDGEEQMVLVEPPTEKFLKDRGAQRKRPANKKHRSTQDENAKEDGALRNQNRDEDSQPHIGAQHLQESQQDSSAKDEVGNRPLQNSMSQQDASAKDEVGNRPLQSSIEQRSLPIDVDPQHTLFSGWLLKQNSGRFVRARSRAVAAVPQAKSLLGRQRFFELKSERLAYRGPIEGKGGEGDFLLSEIDEVTLKGNQILIHFSKGQKTGTRKNLRGNLCLVAPTVPEASEWYDTLKRTVAVQVQSSMGLPREWNVCEMLSGPEVPAPGATPVRLVAEVPVDDRYLSIFQRLVDHAFICKRTKDRRNSEEMPARLEVEKVICVQNAAAWQKYTEARTRIAQRLQSEGLEETVVPRILTASHDDSRIRTIVGEVDATAQEHWLFHGSSWAGVQGIAHRDFRLDLAGTHRGTLYGKGLYLAECSSKADEYAEEHEDGFCRMLLCRATLGNTLTDYAQHPSEALPAECAASYDSLCGDRWSAVGTFREFVLYNACQVLPAYIILYRRKSQADLASKLALGDSGGNSNDHNLILHAVRLSETHVDQAVRYRMRQLLGAHAQSVAPVLVKCLQDERQPIRRLAAWMLGNLGPSALQQRSVLRLDMCNKTQEVKEKVDEPCAEVVAALIVALQANDAPTRKAAVLSLEMFQGSAASAVPSLIRCLKDDDDATRAASAGALGTLNQAASNAGPDLLALFNDPSHQVRASAAQALGRIRPPHSIIVQAIPAMILRMRDEEEDVRIAVATSLGSFGPLAAPAVQTLIERISSGAGTPEHKAILDAFGSMGSHASPAIPCMLESLQDPYPSTREAAIRALGALGPHAPAAVLKIRICLSDPEVDLRIAAAKSLGQFGEHAAPAISNLSKALADTSIEVRVAAAESLGKLGKAAAKAAVPLAERLNDKSSAVRQAVVKAFGQIGAHAFQAVPTLQELVSHQKYEVREAAIAVLKAVAPDTSSSKGLTNAAKFCQQVDKQRSGRKGSKQNDRCDFARPGQCLCPTCSAAALNHL